MNKEKEQWLTEEARKALEGWVARNRAGWELEGADAGEIREDLEAHLWRARGEGGALVTLEEVEGAVAEMGLPGLEPAILIHGQAEEGKAGGFWRGVVDLFKHPFFYTIWPLLVVIFEMITGTLATMFFDPMSRLPQVVLVLGVAVLGVLRLGQGSSGWVAVLRGAGAVVAGYWGLLAVPVLAVGTVFYAMGIAMSAGIGLLMIPIFLLCALAAAAPIYLCYGLIRGAEFSRLKGPWLVGLLLGLGLLLIVEGPAYVSRYAVAADDPGLARKMGAEGTLLAMCYEGSVGRKSFTDTTGFVTNLGSYASIDGRLSVTAKEREKRREFYYRVTGRSSDSERLEDSMMGFGRGSSGVVFDENHGGDGVSARLAGLELHASRLDGHVDSASRLGYWEWTLEFENEAGWDQEARMQILLPKEGVVSRLTLWVNGEPEEAAFSSTSKVTKAYKTIAVRERRDPVLVRWVGADRIMAQCFPVPSRGKMKIRIGMTAPLDEEDRLFLPRLIEKNFGVSGELETSVFIQGDLEMEMEGLQGKGAKDKWRERHGTITVKELMGRHSHVRCYPGEQPEVVWTEDPFAQEGEEVVVRTREDGVRGKRAETVVLVVDGSAYFSEWARAFEGAVAALRGEGHEVLVVAAVGEEVLEVDELEGLEFVGGQDCIPALERGLGLAAEMKATQLVWVHGAQPIAFRSEEGFLQLLERGFHQVPFSVVDLDGGPNRLLEKAAKRVGIAGSARPGGPGELEKELLRLIAPPEKGDRWERRAAGEIPEGAVKVWDQLARWRVWQEVKKASLETSNYDELAKLAARYQLVTPVSGAVVLETKAQYKRFGLEQVDASATPKIPGIPEPSTALLGLLGMLMVWKRQRNLF
ncbi:MAG: VIT domain-containing protein [Verrucomicrobiaceae bacterium]